MGLLGNTNPVFEMLKQDHAKVKQLFQDFEQAKDSRGKQRIIQETLFELEVHAKLEETLIYPAIRKEIEAIEIMDEALEEHHVAHTLINELKRRTGSSGRYEAKFKVLGESIKHHVKEEESTMFSLAEEDADLDWEALAQKRSNANRHSWTRRIAASALPGENERERDQAESPDHGNYARQPELCLLGGAVVRRKRSKRKPGK
jgi:hemerythrin-like domain-containing protein